MIRNIDTLTSIFFNGATRLLCDLKVETKEGKIVIDEKVFNQHGSNFDETSPSYELIVPVVWETVDDKFFPNLNRLIFDIESANNVSRRKFSRYSIAANKFDIRLKVLDDEAVVVIRINYRKVKEKCQ